MLQEVSAGGSVWSVSLLGPVEVVSPQGTVAALGGRKVGLLLARLALSLDAPILREDLAKWCWPESEPESQRTRLRQEIGRLRELFGDAESSPLLDTRLHLGLRSSHVSVDVDRFAQQISQAHAADTPEDRIATLQQALTLYRDDLLIEYGDPFPRRRAELRALRATALYELAEAQQHAELLEEAAATLRTLVAQYPVYEEAHADLMRLYALFGQPSRVRQQYQQLEENLNSELGTSPSASTRELLETLLSEKPTTPTMSAAVSPTPAEPAPLRPAAAPPKAESASSPRVKKAAAALLLSGVLISIALLLRGPADKAKAPVAAGFELRRHHEKWAYVDKPQPGEVPNSEAFTLTPVPQNCLVATGQIETQHDDIDMLTVKLDQNGKVLWRKRFSSETHDCDRARSIAPNPDGSVFVCGESYLAAGHPRGEGWHLALVHYAADGTEKFRRYSDGLIKTTETAQVVADGQGGAFVGATEASGKSAVFLHCGAAGELLNTWRYSAEGSAETSFVRMARTLDGRLVAVCTRTRNDTKRDAGVDWAVVCFDKGGKRLWEQTARSEQGGSEMPSHLAVDRVGNAYVAGTFITGSPGDGTFMHCPALVKYDPSGKELWRRWYAPFGGSVSITWLDVSWETGTATLSGSLISSRNDYLPIALAYSREGALLRKHTGRLPKGFRSARAHQSYLLDDGRMLMVESISPFGASEYLGHAEMAVSFSNADGQDEWIDTYAAEPRKSDWSVPRASALMYSTVAVVGRMPSKAGIGFCVVSFPVHTPR